jgi:hypothetical protein
MLVVDPDLVLREDKGHLPTIGAAPGKYAISYGGMIQSHAKLTTGKLVFEVKDPVAWGKEVAGLQAGLVVTNPNDIHLVGKVKLALRLRNVGKEIADISTSRLWRWALAGIRDDQGKRVAVLIDPPSLVEEFQKYRLKPGEVVDVDKVDLTLITHGETKIPDEVPAIHVYAGVYTAQRKGFVKEYPDLSTGRVSFEVKKSANKVTIQEKSQVEAVRIGKAVLKVEEILKANLADAQKLKGDVVGLGQDTTLQPWVRSRIAYEIEILQSWIRDTQPAEEKEKELQGKIALLQKIIIEIDAPR